MGFIYSGYFEHSNLVAKCVVIYISDRRWTGMNVTKSQVDRLLKTILEYLLYSCMYIQWQVRNRHRFLTFAGMKDNPVSTSGPTAIFIDCMENSSRFSLILLYRSNISLLLKWMPLTELWFTRIFFLKFHANMRSSSIIKSASRGVDLKFCVKTFYL